MSLVSLSQVPTLPADPDALSSTSSALQRSVEHLGDRAREAATSWTAISGVLDAPDTPTLAHAMTLVRDGGEDFAEAFRTIASAVSLLSDRLAFARSTIEQLRLEIPQLRDQVRRHRDALAEDDDLGSVESGWGPGQYEWNARLQSECASVQADIDDAVEQCERVIRGIGSAPYRVATAFAGASAATVVAGPRLTAAMQQSRFEDELALAVLNRLSADGGANSSELLAAHPEWLTMLQETIPAAETVRTWWGGLDATTTAALIAGVPLLVGNLDGVRLADRFTANRTNVQNGIDARREALARAEAELEAMGWEARWRGGALRDEIEEHRRVIETWQALLDGETTTYDENRLPVTIVGSQVAVFDPSRDAIATYHGPIDPATGEIPAWIENVAVSVPGTGANMTGWSDGRASDLHAADPQRRTAVFQWAGGTFPQSIPEATDASFSHQLAPRLASFTNALATPPGASLTVIGHSYGGATLGLAEAAGLDADRIVYVAAAGLGQGNTGLADFPHTADVPHYALMTRNDMVVGPIQGSITEFMHGPSTLSVPGVTRLETGVVDAADPDSTGLEDYNEPGNGTPAMIDGHSTVFRRGSTAFTNIVAVITGGEAELFSADTTAWVGNIPTTQPGYAAPGYEPEYVRIE